MKERNGGRKRIEQREKTKIERKEDRDRKKRKTRKRKEKRSTAKKDDGHLGSVKRMRLCGKKENAKRQLLRQIAPDRCEITMHMQQS